MMWWALGNLQACYCFCFQVLPINTFSGMLRGGWVIHLIWVTVFFSFFRPSHIACRILVPWPRVESRLAPTKMQSPNPWTARVFPGDSIFQVKYESSACKSSKERWCMWSVCVCMHKHVWLCAFVAVWMSVKQNEYNFSFFWNGP